ncbi:hypothetical protein Mgra_00003381 [Meloidogyne graminicola]|uniref:Activin_recp domain-containing protein n=1 Tax=Meloidogyne graminicola TaxID=189291 RepID=A0A8S9ZUJ9_9BILA|nr:hypothetical protein Mgra_00003381 [Meloidogyne graminicola]
MYNLIKNNLLLFILYFLFILINNFCSTTEDTIGNLKDSRYSGTKKYFKCYQGEDGSTKECIGKICIRLKHNQSGADKLSCKNFTEPDDPAVGQCKKLGEGQMPGQSEEMCACEGDYCNGSFRSFASHLIISLCILILCLSTTIFCTILVVPPIF